MITLTLNCESNDEARVYLNAPQYHNLLSDLHAAFRSAQKHGTTVNLLETVNRFMPELASAVYNSEGAY
jgi:hypothetical protein